MFSGPDLTLVGNFEADAAQTKEAVVRYFADPSDHNIRCGIWFSAQLVGRADRNPVPVIGTNASYAGVSAGNVKSVAVLKRLGVTS